MKLYYFNLYGRAEAIRMLLWKAGVQYEDVRLTHEQFAELKPTLEYGQLPMLELDDGTRLVQTPAILTYLAILNNMMPANPMDMYNAQNLSSFLFEDFFQAYLLPLMRAPEDKKGEFFMKLMGEGVPKLWGVMERKIPENGWIGGANLTMVDIAVGAFLHNIVLNPNGQGAEAWKAAWEQAGPKTKAFVDKFAEEFKEYLATRPQCAF